MNRVAGAAFDQAVNTECQEACVAAAEGEVIHPGMAPEFTFDHAGRPCTSAEFWHACRAGYEDGVQFRTIWGLICPWI